MNRVVGQALRSRVTSSLSRAAACLAPAILRGFKSHASIAWPQNTYSGK
jgi:hypothetical protein